MIKLLKDDLQVMYRQDLCYIRMTDEMVNICGKLWLMLIGQISRMSTNTIWTNILNHNDRLKSRWEERRLY